MKQKYTQKMELTRDILDDYDDKVEKVAKDKWDELVDFLMGDEDDEETINKVFAPTLENVKETPSTLEEGNPNELYENFESVSKVRA